MNNKRQKLYDNLIGTGRVSDAEIGTLDEFRSAIKDEKTARQFHKNLLGAGFDEDEIGTEDEFYNSISSDFAENKPKSEPYTHVYGADGSLIGGTAYQGGNVIPKITKENIGSMGFVQDEASALYPMSSTRLQSITSLDGKLRGTEQAEKEFNQVMEEKEIDKYFVPKQMNTADDVYENFATRFTNTQEGVTLNEGIAKKTKEIQDKYLKDYMSSKEFAELSKQYKGEEFQKKANEQFQFMYGDKIENELKPINENYSKAINARYGKQINDELSRIAKNDASTELTRISKSTDEALDSVEEQIKKRRRQLRNDNWKPGHPMDVARNDNMLSELNVEHSYLSTAQNLNDDSMKVLEAAKKEKDGTFIGGLGRGVADSVFDIDTWTMGITGMVDEMRLNNVLTKSEKGEKLTDAEKNLLDACVNNMAINHYYGSDLGYGYQAGKITGESLPFMLEFLINPVSASGKTLAKRILTWGLKNNIKGMSTKGAKMAARFLGDAIAAGGVTLSSGAGMVGEGTVERLNRNFKFSNDDNGNLVVTNTGEISTGEAFGKSLTSAFLERQSEMIFNAFRPLKGKPVNTLAERMQWHGLAEEQLEEVYNNFMNIPLGEMTLEEATSLEQNLITFLGLAPTQVAFSAVGGVGYAVERYNAKKKIREAYGALTPEQQDKLKELEELAKDHRNRDIAIFLSETLKDKSLTQEQKRAELEYAYNLVVNNAIKEAEEAETQSRVEADNASIDAATDTQTGNYAQVTAILSDGLGGTKEVVGNVVGWIGDSPIFVADGMENTEENRRVLKQGEWNPETLIARPAEEVKVINEDIIREEVAAQAERESKYAPEVLSRKMEQGIPFETADAIYLPIQPMAEGNGWTVEVQPKATNNKTASKSEVIELTNDEFYDLLQADLEAQEAVQAEIAQSESVGEQVNTPVNTEVNNPIENTESTPMSPMETQGSTPMSPMSEEVQSATEEKSTQPVIPTKEDGSIDFVAYGREGTLKTLGEKYGEKLPNKVAVTAKALAEDVVKAEEKLAKAEEAYDNAPIGREQKAEQARDKARQELEEVKKEAEYWKAIDEEIKEAQKARETIVNPTVEPDMTDEPMTTEEFVAKALADGGIRLTSDSYKKELGYGEKERKRFPKMFAKKENGGLSIEEAGEWLMQWDSENGTNFFDQEDANAGRDALINFLGSVRTWGDITGYIRRNREQLAERESEGLRNEVESAIDANYHMTPEEYATLQEVESVENPFGGLDVATKDAIFVEAYEEYEQSLNPKQNDEGRTSEIAEGNGVVLPEERTDNEGGTSERQGERPDLSEGAVQQNDAAQEAEQVEEPITIQEGESPVAFAERVLEEQRRKPLRNRANEWAKALGVKVHFIERLEDVENQAAYLALSNGSKVAGWYEGATGEVFLYMPNLDNVSEVDKTYIHEVVAHKGLREMLGKERFNELCDKVWDMMPDKEKAEFIQYEGVNGDTRAAADEYIAYLAEKENLTPEEQTIWDSIVKMFRDMLDRALNGIIGKSKLTDKDISDLIKASYANLKSGAEGGVGGDSTRFRTLEQINSEFNENLQKQIEGALPNGYIYQLGSPSAVLRSAGIEDLPIELAASRLVDKSMQDNHPFELSEVENLPEAIHNPLAVFVSATRVGSNVILTELKHGGKNFVAALRVRPNKKRIEVNQIRSLYPKNTNGIIDWINNGLATYVDKERMVEWVEKQRNELLSKPQSNSVEVREQLVSATKIVNDFENPTLPEEKSLFRVVYHGSASSFDKFSKDFIGSGEGNSVAGYGFYVTSDDSVGRYYADFSSKSKRKVIQPEGYTVNGELVKDSALVNAYNLLKENEFDVEKSISYVEERIEQKKKEPKKGIFGSTKLYENMLVYLQKEQDNPGILGYQEEVIEQPGRYLFEVEIPDDNGKNYLDLDKSVPKNVKEKAKEKLLEYLYNGEDAEYWENNKSIIEEQWKLVEKKGATAETLRSTMQEIVGREEVSDIFSSMGYIGFKTYEDSERGTTYVIFDESNLNIVNHIRFRVKGISGLKPLEVADKIKDCFYEDVAKSDRIAMVEYLQQNESGKAVIDRMYQHNGTGWARQTANATFVRIALNDLIEGREPSVQSMLTRGREHPVVKYIKQLGKEGVWRYIQTFGLLGEAGKPVNNVNGSFLSCNPSNECAKYCYATKGNYIYAGSSVKSELVYWCIVNDPIRAAQRIVDEYKSKPQYYEGKALRLFDKGDIDMAWIPVIEELNKQGVVTQVFSKRPEILERVDKGLNVVMMSIDSSNSDMLDEYPTMPVALVYRGNVDSELLEKCKDRLQQYGGVILPVKIGQKLLSENEVKSLPLWTRPYQCPIDNGKRQINDKENPERSWNCTKCDKNGGVGCFFHRTANKLRKDRYENETKSTSGRTERDNQRSSSRNAESSNGGSVPLHSTNGAVGDIEFRRELLRTLRESLAEGGLSDADITPKLLETLDRRLRGMLEGRGTQSSSSTLSTNSLEESREIGQGYERGDRPESDSRIKSEGGTRFRISNQNQEIFVSNAQKAVEGIKQEKGTPQQWLAMIEKNGGLKAGEDKWLGLSDWLKGLDKKSVTKDEILEFIGENKIRIEEVKYADREESDGDFESLIADYKGLNFRDSFFDAFGVDFDEVYISNEQEAVDLYNKENGTNMSLDEYGYLEERDEEVLIEWAQSVMSEATEASGVNPINSTRLEYTTEGLENKAEIALTVPTIESWNESDEIHFGDAGEGRAVAWIRFGETFIMEDDNYIREVTEVKEPYRDVNGLDIYKTDSGSNNDFIAHGKGRNGEMIYVAYVNGKQIPVTHKTLEDAKAEMNKFFKEHPIKNRKRLNVLVIDEIQSKRHQEGREKGYKPNPDIYLKENGIDVVESGEFYEFYKNGELDKRFAKSVLNNNINKAKDLYVGGQLKTNIPEAPFEKNWSELAMKRMLRYAAENGFDKVAWTKGVQQAQRYSLGNVVDSISISKSREEEGKYHVTSWDMGTMPISAASGNKTPNELKELFGKEIAQSLIEGVDNLEEGSDTFVLEGTDLEVGGEGMKGFYDKMLPSFVNKYVKKWGTKVQDIELPNVEEAGRIMHSVDVTDAMKESVMEGQTMFRVVREPAVDYISQANDVVEVPRDEVMYTMNNIASQLYKTSGRFMRQLYQNGTLGRVLKGDYAEIDQIKAKNEYDHAKPILDEYLNELVWMKYQATEAAQEVINDVISDVEYAIKYYKDLSLGKDVWRTEERPRFRIVEKQREDVNKGVDSFTSKYNSKPVSVASSDMTDEELEKAVPTLLVEDTRKAIEEGAKGKYSVKADKIYIFADNVTKEELEDTLFHENLHPMFSGNPIIEEFYANFNAKHPEQVKMLAEGYEESEVPEEVFVTNLAVGMQRGNFKMVEPFLAESSREDLYNTLKAFGYDYEQERGGRNPERNSGKGSDVAEGKKVANRSRGKENSEGQRESSREQAEKLRDLFGRVADMGLDGVLGNEAYDRAMMDIYSVLPEDSRKEVIDDAFNHYGMNIAPAVSDYIHGKSDGNILDKIVAIIRNVLRKAGFDIDLNGNEVKYLAWRSKKPLDRSNLVDIAEDIYKKYQLKVGEYSTNDDGTTPDGGGTRFRRVYHGSSASFDKFDHSFMGTGEGNQSFGWGSYVTDVKEVGEKYAGLKADNSPIASQTLRWLDENPTYEAFITKGEGARRKKTIANAKEFLKEMKEDGASEDVINAYEQDLKDAERAITEDGYNQTKENMVASLNRHLYEVEIPDDNGSNYIAWDKMLPKEQAERIKDAIRNSKFFKEYEKDYKQLAEERLDAWTKTNGGRAYKLLGNIVWNEKDLSQILSEAGFAGFKYPTNYFSGGNEDGSNNYVIFNEDDLKIVEHTRFRVANKLQVRDDYEATIKKSGFQAREAVQDAMLSLRRFQELIEKESGKKLKDFENAWMHENRLSSVVQAAIHEMERKFYKPMMESVKKLMKAADIKQEEVADYLMLKHGIERNREMAVRKALTDAEGKIDRAHLEQWYQDKEAIRNDASLDTWRKKQEAMDNLALSYGADMSRDYSGLTSMFDTDDIEECTNRAYDEVEALENAYPAEIEALGKAVKAMTQNTLDESFRSGLMDRKVYDELSKDMYDYYIPLRGFEETTSEEVYAYLDQDRGAFNAPLQRAKGRSSKSDNPIAYLKSIAESGIMQGERNKMKQTFLNMVINHPSDLVSIHEGVWVVFNPATGEWEAAAPPAIPNNATPADVEAAMEAWEQQMEQAAQNDPTLVKKVSEASDIPYRVVGNRMNQHQIIVKRLGKSYTLTVNGNPRLAMALNGLTNPNNTSNDGKVSAYVSGKFGALNRFLASVYTTKNPDFVVSNFLRDTFYTNTIVRAKEGNSYANKFHKHYAELLMPGKMISLFKKYENGTLDMSNATEAAFKDFMMNGGETGYSNLKDLENIKKQIAKDLKGNRLEVVEKVAEKLDILNRAVENTARFAAYLTSREEGRSIAKSVFDAKEISVNFNKKGAGGTFFGMTGQTKLGNLAAMVGAGGRALYVFFNAAIQGTTNLLHVMKKSPKGTSAGIAAMFLMGAVLPFLLDDDEEKDYYDLPEHVRRNHLILPGFGDAWISIPLPIEYRIMYGMGELLTSWRTGHERGSDIGRKMLNLTGQALPLNFLEEGFDAFIPSSLSPLWQVYNNRSWTGLPLYKDNEFNKDDPEYTKAYKNVDKTLYNVSKALYDWTFDEENQEAGINLNPAVLEALARGYFGGFATQLGNLGKTWETIAGEREFDWRSIPIGNRVFKSGDERTKEKRITNEYFENMEKLDFMQSRERTLKKTINGVSVPQEDKDRAKEDYDKMKDTDIYKKYQEFKKKKKDVDKLRKQMKEKGSTEELEKKLTTAQEEANKVVR